MAKKMKIITKAITTTSIIILLSSPNVIASGNKIDNLDLKIVGKDSIAKDILVNNDMFLLAKNYNIVKSKPILKLFTNHISLDNLNREIKSTQKLDLTIDNIKIGENIEYYKPIIASQCKKQKISDFDIYTFLEKDHNAYTAIIESDNKVEAVFTTKNILKDYNILDKDNIESIRKNLKDNLILEESKYKEIIGNNILLKNYNDKLSIKIDNKRIDVYFDKYDGNEIIGYYIYIDKNQKYLEKPKFKDTNLNEEEIKILSRQTLDLINVFRKSKGIEKLEWSEKLEDVARDFSIYSIKNNHYGHIDKEGLDSLDRINKKGYKANYVGENILKYPNIVPLPIDMLNSYIHSEGHRRNILNTEYRYYGTSINCSNTEVHNTQMFSKEIN